MTGLMGLVHEIERRYPPERTERSKARLRAVWKLELPPDRLPFVFVDVPTTPGGPECYSADGIYSDEESLRLQLNLIIDRAELQDDYIPSLYPGCRLGTIPTAFGAQEVRAGGHYWPQPVIRDASDAFELGRPDFRTQGVAAAMLERIRHYRRATQGRIPIQLLDMQGPLDLAGLMWGVEPLLVAMHTSPDAVHRLLQRMTEAFIEYVRLVWEAAEGDLVPFHCSPALWMPHDRGIALSEDLLAVISPRLYPIFARPYNEQIAAAFGGCTIHSCGDVGHNLRVLAETRGLAAVHFNSGETSLSRILGAFGRRAVVVVEQALGVTDHPQAKTLEDCIQLCLEAYRQAGAPGAMTVWPRGASRPEALELALLASQAASVA
jgi:hypothetical protein